MGEDAPDRPKVLVGVDGSSTARAALDWAAVQADRRDLPLVVVYALSVPLARTANTEVLRLPPSDMAVTHGEHVLAEAAEHVRAHWPTGQVETTLALEKPAVALTLRAGPADLIVVGSRGLGALGSAFLGSTSVRLAARAPCPVVVVHGTHDASARTRPPQRIVVGVDGSECSQRALAFALEQATRGVDAALVVVHSMESPTPFASQSLVVMSGQSPDLWPEHLARGLVTDMIEQAGADTADNVEVGVVCTRQPPADALLTEGAEADLVVLGSRGRGGLRGLFLGSVSQSVLHRARVPVAVVPHRGAHDADIDDQV